MSNVLMIFWKQLFGEDDQRSTRLTRRLRVDNEPQATATIFIVMRRMRAPLITLIVIFSVTVFGMTLIPAQDPSGQPYRMSIFQSLYFMSYTASTIGYGELPFPFNANQRMWAIISIYLLVIGWAYAIGSMLTLLQDQTFRSALALQRFRRKVRRLREPFLLFAGYGQTGELLGQALDAMGQQFVVIDSKPDRIDSLDLVALHSDVPALAGDVRNPHHLAVAGLDNPYCSGVLALTSDDEVNLHVIMAAALLRPELPVITRVVSPAIEYRMQAFGTPSLVNPFDRFGDHLRLALRAPASYQLLTWLESGPGAARPARAHPPTDGRWVLAGYGRFGKELVADLRDEGLAVTIIDPLGNPEDPAVIVGDASEPAVLKRADLATAVGFVAGTDNDTTNLSLAASARRINPKLFLAARQNLQASAPLFRAMRLDALLVPTEVVAHEMFAQLSTPLLWRFVQEIQGQPNEWAAHLMERITGACGRRLQELWKERMVPSDAPALCRQLLLGDVRLGDVLRNPDDRDRKLDIVPLLVLRGQHAHLTPDDDFVLRPDDELLLTGRSQDRRAMENTFYDEGACEYVLHDQHLPSSWVWRKVSSSVRRAG